LQRTLPKDSDAVGVCAALCGFTWRPVLRWPAPLPCIHQRTPQQNGSRTVPILYSPQIDGFGLPMLAGTWAVASPSERPSLELGARLVLAVIGGPSVIALTFVWGSTLALYGLAVKKEGYSSWLGWTGVILGAVIFVMGTIFYLKPNIYPGVLLYGGGTWAAHLWAICLGIAMWRRSGAVAVAHAPQQ
jgi:hypothetical protein